MADETTTPDVVADTAPADDAPAKEPKFQTQYRRGEPDALYAHAGAKVRTDEHGLATIRNAAQLRVADSHGLAVAQAPRKGKED